MERACITYPACSSPPSSLLSDVDKPTIWLENGHCRTLWIWPCTIDICEEQLFAHITYSAGAGVILGSCTHSYLAMRMFIAIWLCVIDPGIADVTNFCKFKLKI